MPRYDARPLDVAAFQDSLRVIDPPCCDLLLVPGQGASPQLIPVHTRHVNLVGHAATVDAILDAADRMEKHGGAESPTVLPFSVRECAELPPPGLIGTVCYRAGAALMLRSMHLYRMPEPARFKESAERLGIERLDCPAPDGTLVEGCNLSTLSMLSVRRAAPARLDVAGLFRQMRAMPRLRCVMLPHGLELPGIPQGWDYGPAMNVLQRHR
jgi:hypothetical protein